MMLMWMLWLLVTYCGALDLHVGACGFFFIFLQNVLTNGKLCDIIMISK